MQIILKLLSNFAANYSRHFVVVFMIALFAFYSITNASASPQDGQQSSQNNVPISGVITGESDNPLQGATIYVKEYSTGTVTDFDGGFMLNIPEGVMLTISYMGYETIDILSTAKMNIKLSSSAHEIEETVVVAYGVQKKVSVTGAVSSIQTKDLKQSSAANLSSALAGRLPGLTTIQTSGQPGRDDVSLYLRGAGTLNGQAPLILIDGVTRDNISTLDPNEVASVTVLKDASATAVFGVRGANGAILITTRRGEIGKTELSVNADFSWQSFIAERDRVHSWEFAELRNQAHRNSDAAEEYTPYMIEMYKNGEDRIFYPDRETESEMFRKWAPQQRVNVNLNGGTEKVQYFVNAGYLHQGGNFKTESKSQLGYDPSFKMDRYNFRGNLDFNITKGLKASLNVGSYIEKMNTPALVIHTSYEHLATDLMHMTWNTPATSPGPLTEALGDRDGDGIDDTRVPVGESIANIGNTYGILNRSGYRMRTTTDLNTSLAVDWDLKFITKGLSTKVMVAYDNRAYSTMQAQRWFNTYYANVATKEGDPNFYTSKDDTTDDALKLAKSFESQYYLNMQYSINYARSFGKHDVTGLALVQRDNYEKYAAAVPYNMLGLSGRLTYAYDYRYLVEFNIGYNGTEQFNPSKRFGLFPAVSAGWIVSNEEFLKNNKIITNLKLRASYGKVGNDKQGDQRFLYLDDIRMEGGWIPSLGHGQQLVQGRVANYDITWETADKQNYGIDFQLFRELSLSFDYFIENRKDILIARSSVPALQGIPLSYVPRVNMGKVKNSGYELEMTYNKLIANDLRITLRGNFAFNKNIINEIDEPMLSDEYYYRYRRTGYSMGQNWGYLRDFHDGGNGYINTQEELDNLPVYQIGSPRIGDFKYIDVNNDGYINEKDQVPIGYSNIPRVTYGLSLALDYKGFDLSVLFQGIGKVSRFYQDQGVYEVGLNGFYSGYHLNAWTEERYVNQSKITYPALGTVKGSNHLPNDFFIMDRSFMRLKNLELGYTLPEHTLRALSISRVRVYVSGNNLFTWSKLRDIAVDPEQNTSLSYPITRMVNVGVNFTF